MSKSDEDNLDIARQSSGGGGDARRRFDEFERYFKARISSEFVSIYQPREAQSMPTWGDLVALARSQRELEGEVERLRAALQLIADTRDGTLNNVPRVSLSQCVEIARAALERPDGHAEHVK